MQLSVRNYEHKNKKITQFSESMNNNQPVQPIEPVQLVVMTLMLSKLIFLCITALPGLASFIYFTYEGNYYAAGACFQMEYVSYHVFRLNSVVMDGKLKAKYNACGLWFIFITSIVVGVLSYVGAVGYATLGGIYNQGFQMENDGDYVCIIPCSVALFWSIVLAVASRSCMKDLHVEQEDRKVLHRRGGTDIRRF